ncbi:hypothetical protein GYMLUDRAFT_70336 [Collybiopsis luxurians FD-317 M1]|nr:hypothetical protein GYMLUDRAFT_70336 [Collybiopsis luxurians FD-317 M1]
MQQSQLLKQLPISPSAESDKAVKKECHPGTCVKVIEAIKEWVSPSGKDSRPIYWLHGPPSSGKTSIITEVIKTIEAPDLRKNISVVDFICTRVVSDGGDAKTIMPTLAYKLAEKNRAYRRKLINRLESVKPPILSIASWPPSKQFKELLLAPLKEMDKQQQVILIVDSLEECAPESYSYQTEGRKLVTDLVKSIGDNIHEAPNLKVLISSHPVDMIKESLESLDSYPSTVTSYDMMNYLESDAKADIRKFYDSELNDIQREEFPDWKGPSPYQLNGLVYSTGTSFLIAQTVCRMVRQSFSPEKIMENLLQMPADEFRSSGTQGLYKPILDDAVQNLSGENLDLFRKAVMSIVLLKRLLSAEDLAAILGIDSPAVLRKCLRGVSSIMVVPMPLSNQKATGVQRVTDVIRVHDTTFIDYMRDTKMDHNSAWIKPYIHSCAMAGYLLKFLNKRLKPIEYLSQFDKVHDDSPGVLEIRQNFKHKKLNRAVVYACRFWMYHITESRKMEKQRDDKKNLSELAKIQIEVIKELKTFLHPQKLLSWIYIIEQSHILNQAPLDIKKAKSWLNDLNPIVLSNAHKSATSGEDSNRNSWFGALRGPSPINPQDTKASSEATTVPFDERDLSEAIRLADKSLEYLGSKDLEEQLVELRGVKEDGLSMMEDEAKSVDGTSQGQDPVQGLRLFFTPGFDEEVQEKVRDLRKTLRKKGIPT